MKKILFVLILLPALAGADTYEKVDDSSVKITRTVEKIEDVNFLKRTVVQLEKQKVSIQSKIDEINIKIAEAEKVGVIPSADAILESK